MPSRLTATERTLRTRDVIDSDPVEAEPVDVDALVARAAAAIGSERDAIANAANFVAFLMDASPSMNWVGFYFVRGDELVLGPFAGKPAVTRIVRGAGVCGAAWERARTVVVPDVHAFPGHIACDLASRSELVVPLVRDGVVVGVLDADSPVLARFTGDDARAFEALAKLYVERSEPA